MLVFKNKYKIHCVSGDDNIFRLQRGIGAFPNKWAFGVPNAVLARTIPQKVRFLFNLYYNSQSKEYVDLENDTSVVKISDDNLVSIHKRYLKSYLAIKNMALIIHIDSRCTDIVEDIFPTDSFDYRNDDNTVFYTVNIGRGHNGIQEENFSILFGKKVLFGCKLKDCNIWPYNEKKQYIEFIVGVDDNGRELHYTCDPSKLSKV